ncbi:MAG: hypothetical protein AUJ56_03300 [Zetaproteobacteria bacterium CG1_02_49_23]|nr:MAG: hypothetical protein AUJ56_03300 [Zetaproteobacteria bacterium CG1_02_49_23]
MNNRLELLLFGGFDLYLDQKPIKAFSYNTMRALMAYLVVEPSRDYSREFLAELLWERQEMATARANLRRTLSHLRQAIEIPSGKTLFVASKHSLRFIPDLSTDLYEFVAPLPSCTQKTAGGCSDCLEQMERMAALYRGELLYGLSLPESSTFDEWLQMQRENMHKRALMLLEHISNCHEQLGQYSRALPFARRFSELEPWDETGHQRLMRLYALNGQVGAANRQYNTCCQLLKTELGVLPGNVTRALAQQIRQKAPSPVPPLAAEVSVTLPSPLNAERRKVTVLYCELTLEDAADDDPDELLDRLQAPQSRCIEIIRHHSGHVLQTHGGGLLVYFGYPQAAEDAPRRAVQAALAIGREMAGCVGVRSGIHTGLIITNTDTAIPDIAGKTSQIAIQLRDSIAHHGTVISQSTHAIVTGYFTCLPMKDVKLPRAMQSITSFVVLGESGAQTRLDAAKQLTPLVGREGEINTLMSMWQQSRCGQYHTVLVQGEAGIGKSRLVLAFRNQLQDAAPTVRELRCSGQFSSSAFHPLLVMLEEEMKLRLASAEEKSRKLIDYFECLYPSQAKEGIPLLSRLLSLPLPERYTTSTLSGQPLKEQTNTLFLELLRGPSSRQPLLLIVEDLHWADPSTLALLGQYFHEVGERPAFTLLTARAGFVSPWHDSDVTPLPLPPLSSKAIEDMITAIDARLPMEIRQRIVERTDGIPLYAEELARFAVAEKADAIPGTLHDLLAARIDRLGSAKCCAQLAATIGREFSLTLLERMQQEISSSDAIESLFEAGIITRLDSTTAQFSHVLIQEAAYQSQTRANRQLAHRRIAEILLNDFSEIGTTQPEVIAQHLYNAGDLVAAVEQWINAGQRSLLNAAHAESLAHFHAGQRALAKLPADHSHDQLEMKLNLLLGASLTHAKGYGSEEAKTAYAGALESSGIEVEETSLFSALQGLWISEHAQGRNLIAVEIAQQLLHLAQQSADPIQLQAAHESMGTSTGTFGDLQKARYHFEQALALYRPEHHEEMMRRYNDNFRIKSGAHLSMVLMQQGFPDQALAEAQATLALAQTGNNPHLLCYGLNGVALIRRWRHEAAESEPFAAECLAVARKFALPVWLLLGSAAFAWARAAQNDGVEMDGLIAQVHTGETIPTAIRAQMLRQIGEGLVFLQRFDEALKVLDESIELANRLHERYVESEYQRLKGECLLQQQPADLAAAEACFHRSLAISRNQGALFFELCATISLSQLWQQRGCLHDALPLLENICGRFTEGFETPDYRMAKQLLHAAQRA